MTPVSRGSYWENTPQVKQHQVDARASTRLQKARRDDPLSGGALGRIIGA
jgi:hypothetical protein